jgi:thiosulfate/3-mercaptopyruvate sulfurtransferase
MHRSRNLFGSQNVDVAIPFFSYYDSSCSACRIDSDSCFSYWLQIILASSINEPNIVILDARGIIPYRFRHIKNARSLGIESVISLADNGANLVIDAATAENVFSSLGIDDSKTVIVYGESVDPSAARIVWTLMYYGHTNVKLLDIGFSEWQRAGYPVTREVIRGESQEKHIGPAISSNSGAGPTPIFKSKINQAIRADADYIKTKQTDPDVVIIDARTPQEHFAARIPDSILDNWEEGLDFGHGGVMIKSKTELEAHFREKGIAKEKEIICYCHVGIRASHKYLQFKQAGYHRVKVYDGSIVDWAQRRNPLR